MTSRNMAIFISADLAMLLIVLLLLSYYGMSHLFLLAMGLILLMISLYDLRTGIFSELFSDFFGLSDPDEQSRVKWIPVILSTILLFLSVPVFIEHGFINSAQRWAMQDGHFIRLAIPALTGGIVVIAVAVWTIFIGSNKK